MKTQVHLCDGLDLVTVDHNGQQLTFLNGVLQMPAKNKFIVARSPVNGALMLIIEDYVWWTQNEKSILTWMDHQLPRGRDHQQGMIVNFDDEQQREWFLLRWS